MDDIEVGDVYLFDGLEYTVLQIDGETILISYEMISLGILGMKPKLVVHKEWKMRWKFGDLYQKKVEGEACREQRSI